ncbi:MAG TPA: hypothetical protein VMW28_02405 [Pelolinea sp.]|nr:hypothetical protein [Pelolinea sp.]
MSVIQRLTISSTSPFDFESTINSHGWVVLLPNIYLSETNSFSRVDQLPSGKIARLTIHPVGNKDKNQIGINVETSTRISPADEEFIIDSVWYMLRLGEDFGDFYRLCRKTGGAWKTFTKGKGRMLRSPSLFEDLVKVICTTNIQWGGTKRMVNELVNTYGFSFELHPDLKTFPLPDVIARDSLADFKAKVRLGYRAEYIYGLAHAITRGDLNLISLKDPSIPTIEIKKALKAIKGIGDYASASMLMLLGRYDEIPVDTVFRDFMTEKYFPDRPYVKSDALDIYKEWGKWKYLAYWFEMLESD